MRITQELVEKIQDFASELNHYDSDDFTPPESGEILLDDRQGSEWLDSVLKHCVSLTLGYLEEIFDEEKLKQCGEMVVGGNGKKAIGEFKRLTQQSEAFDGFTLKELCESSSEMGCGEYCEIVQGPNCETCPIQEAFSRLAQYEDIGSPEEFAELNLSRGKAFGTQIPTHD